VLYFWIHRTHFFHLFLLCTIHYLWRNCRHVFLPHNYQFLIGLIMNVWKLICMKFCSWTVNSRLKLGGWRGMTEHLWQVSVTHTWITYKLLSTVMSVCIAHYLKFKFLYHRQQLEFKPHNQWTTNHTVSLYLYKSFTEKVCRVDEIKNQITNSVISLTSIALPSIPHSQLQSTVIFI
jgi:hypothetical protein